MDYMIHAILVSSMVINEFHLKAFFFGFELKESQTGYIYHREDFFFLVSSSTASLWLYFQLASYLRSRLFSLLLCSQSISK